MGRVSGNIISRMTIPAVLAVGMAFCFIMSSCHGRRAGDPLPQGDTVEVIIPSSPDLSVTDTTEYLIP